MAEVSGGAAAHAARLEVLNALVAVHADLPALFDVVSTSACSTGSPRSTVNLVAEDRDEWARRLGHGT